MPLESDDPAIDRVVELTRALEATNDSETVSTLNDRRARLLDRLELHLHLREEDAGKVLVLYPSSWIEDGVVDPGRIESVNEAIEIPLFPSVTEDDWAEVHESNMSLADEIEARFGPVHGENIRSLGTYLSNHHLTRFEDMTDEQCSVFRDDYFVRNVWATAEQKAMLDRSLTIIKRYCQSA